MLFVVRDRGMQDTFFKARKPKVHPGQLTLSLGRVKGHTRKVGGKPVSIKEHLRRGAKKREDQPMTTEELLITIQGAAPGATIGKLYTEIPIKDLDAIATRKGLGWWQIGDVKVRDRPGPNGSRTLYRTKERPSSVKPQHLAESPLCEVCAYNERLKGSRLCASCRD